MRARPALRIGVLAIVIGTMLAYLHDPPWIGSVTAGLHEWESEPSGDRFRWTSAHATFYVPSDISTMTLPIKGVFGEMDGRPGTVEIAVDDRWLATFTLPNSEWIQPRLALGLRSTTRRYRRIDLRVSRTVGPRKVGVKLGKMVLQ
jgi:hypothetical protein